MSLSFNSLSERFRARFHNWTGEAEMRDHLVRCQHNYQDFSLSASQMDTLNATPITVLAAPGKGLINVVNGLFLFVDAGSAPFELGTGVLEFRYTDATGATVVTDIINATVESATDTHTWAPPIVVVPVVNDVIVAHTSTDVTAGNGVIYGRLFYQTILVSEIA